MKNVIKTIKTLEIIWPGYSTANTMCRILDRLEEDLISYWEPYWDGERDEIGIRFASEEGEIEARPGCVVLVEGETDFRNPGKHRTTERQAEDLVRAVHKN